MSEPPEADQQRYMAIMLANDEQHRAEASQRPAVPMCHFTPMEFHADDSYQGGDGYQCIHCGHTETSEEAWTKVEARHGRFE